jgi:hypothetical protein
VTQRAQFNPVKLMDDRPDSYKNYCSTGSGCWGGRARLYGYFCAGLLSPYG